MLRHLQELLDLLELLELQELLLQLLLVAPALLVEQGEPLGSPRWVARLVAQRTHAQTKQTPDAYSSQGWLSGAVLSTL